MVMHTSTQQAKSAIPPIRPIPLIDVIFSKSFTYLGDNRDRILLFVFFFNYQTVLTFTNNIGAGDANAIKFSFFLLPDVQLLES